ncbi:MAG: 16S rRNA (guanine(966)-N(2))-methyltransferase RsmD [Candidatus Rokubacteria bacterium]|nr:16S rRNA (guanine(966)-N(2))-methyltransferase RsmD [Candidatus Rokubacteria bacterium]
MMRVIAGHWKGMRLSTPAGRTIRPTADQVRAALMDTLSPWLPGARFLDLFAGAGGVGIEALSRGAAGAIFVEIDPIALAPLRENLRHLGARDRGRVMRREVSEAIEAFKGEGERFKLIFLDPPYGSALAAETLKRLADGALLEPDGVVIAQHLTKEPLPERFGSLVRWKTRRFGETTLTFFRLGE